MSARTRRCGNTPERGRRRLPPTKIHGLRDLLTGEAPRDALSFWQPIGGAHETRSRNLRRGRDVGSKRRRGADDLTIEPLDLLEQQRHHDTAIIQLIVSEQWQQ